MSRALKMLLVSLAVLLVGTAAAVKVRGAHKSEGAAGAQTTLVAQTGSAWQNVLVPDHATDGVLTIVIPLGAADEMDAGNPSAVQLPPVMRLKVGDRIVIRNDDDRPHLVMYAYVQPGETNQRVLDKTGMEVYSAGCSVTAESTGTFMSMMVGS
jgi:hypothetical protein